MTTAVHDVRFWPLVLSLSLEMFDRTIRLEYPPPLLQCSDTESRNKSMRLAFQLSSIILIGVGGRRVARVAATTLWNTWTTFRAPQAASDGPLTTSGAGWLTKIRKGGRAMWPTTFWLFPYMPWLIASRLPAAYYMALMPVVEELTPKRPRRSAEIIPFRPRRVAMAG
jgi:hypothetical protein